MQYADTGRRCTTRPVPGAEAGASLPWYNNNNNNIIPNLHLGPTRPHVGLKGGGGEA